MRIPIDLDYLDLIADLNDRKRVTEIRIKRGDSTPFEVPFVRGGVLQELPAGAVLTFACKAKGKYDADPVVFHSEFEVTGDPGSPVYLGFPSFNTVELNDLFHIDSDATNDVAEVELMGEFSWAVAGTDPVSVRTFKVIVANDVIRGDEGVPTTGPNPGVAIGAWAILYTGPQALDGGQKAQARGNMGLGTASTLDWSEGADVVGDPGKLARYGASGELVASILIARRNDDSMGMIGVENADLWSGVISSEHNTAHRYYTLPNASGNLALCSSNTGQITLADVGIFTSATLRGRTTDPTGTGALVFANTPTLVTPALGVATATSLTTNTISPTANNRLSFVANNPGGGAMVLGNTGGATCYAAFDLLNYLGVQGGGFGLANSSAGAFPNSVYFYGVNDLFLQAGSTKMKIVAVSGNFLFGTETDNGARLQVAGTMTVSGTAAFADQVTLTGQTASTPTAAMTRALTEEITGLTPVAWSDLNSATTYNGSNQVSRWFFQSAETPQGGDITPTAAIIKGTSGPKLTAGNGTSVFAVRGGDTEPRTMLVVCRVLGSGAGQGRIRHRSWNLFANSGSVWLTVGSGGSHRTLATGTWDNTKVIIAAWSGNAAVTRGGLWHNGTFTTGNYAGPVNYDSNGGQLVDLGAGAGGAAGDVEIVSYKIFGGCATEAQLRALLATEAKLWT